MIHLQAHKHKPTSPGLTAEEKAVSQLIGLTIAEQPQTVAHLVRRYGAALSNRPSAVQLLDAVLELLEDPSNGFRHELAKIMVPEDAFDPATAIAGAVGGIGNALGGLFNKRERRAQARQESMMGLLAMKQQQEAAAVAAEQRQADQAEKANNAARQQRTRRIQLILLIVALGGLLWWMMQKRHVPPQTTIAP